MKKEKGKEKGKRETGRARIRKHLIGLFSIVIWIVTFHKIYKIAYILEEK